MLASTKHMLATTAGALLIVLGTADLARYAQAQEATVTAPVETASLGITDKRPIVHPGQVRFGAYDPHGDFSAQKDVTTEHLFLPWEDVDLSSLTTADAYAQARGRNLLISIEPWSWDVDWRVTSDELRQRVLRGDYDAAMQAIAAEIAKLKSPVIVRWAQEMEDTSGRFSWANWAPQDYITAYRRMMDIVRKEAPSAKVMWSPKGMPGLNAYYPGDDYADLIGLSVFGLEGYDERAYGGPRTFAESLKQGYDLVSGYGKPIWVAELGYEGSDTYMKPWIETVTLAQEAFPQLTDVVYFNDRDVVSWPYGLGRPNWRVVEGEQTN